MMTAQLKGDFEGTKSGCLDAEAYRQILENLLAQGKGFGKVKDVGGYLLRDIVVVTEDDKGNEETRKNVAVEPLYVAMDLNTYPSETVRQLVIKDTATNWAGRVIRERDLDTPDFRGPDVWAVKKGSFEFDYISKDPANLGSSVFIPNPEAYRVCLPVEKTTTVLMHWGEEFTIEAGGVLAVREKDAAALADALQSIREGKATAEEALYTTSAKGAKIAKFDVYGMKPGFLEGNYGEVALKPETVERVKALQDVKAPAAQQEAAPKRSGWRRFVFGG